MNGCLQSGLNCILTVYQLQHNHTIGHNRQQFRKNHNFSYYDLLYRQCCMSSFLLRCLPFSICLNLMRNSCHKKRFEETFYSYLTLSFDMLGQGLVNPLSLKSDQQQFSPNNINWYALWRKRNPVYKSRAQVHARMSSQ